ncbi:MAG: Adaptive-response sensory-kinase SasA [Chroococcopsis gigantea SAG 12.99]|jgi:OmpR-family two-component system manganese-sensing sensor histidine kinase|nr:Adaptive-response sensory-kinase SasA [Chroococcopsis gigantea SAG 12.99]
MFQQIRQRLLLSYLSILALILLVFALGVRITFIYSLQEKLIEKLIALGQGASTSVESDGGQIKIESEGKIQQLLNKDQSIQWFDKGGRIVTQQGKIIPSLAFSNDKMQTVQNGKRRIQSVVLPVYGIDNNQLVGYIRVNQSLDEFQETIYKLDWGLGIGIIFALLLSGIGGLILTRQAMQPIEDSFQRLKQFTADASHELRSPLMAITSNVAVSLKYPEGMRESDLESFECIASATEQMTALTENLLLLARNDNVQSNTSELVDITSILTGLEKRYQEQAAAKNINLLFLVKEGLLTVGNREQLTRVFSNLIDNALYYTPDNGTVTVKGGSIVNSVEITIKDTGIGIAKEHQEKIFERFWRLNTSRSYHQGGSGLGLAIGRSIVQSHRGSITVDSVPGQGSRFSVILPGYLPLRK